MIQTISVKHFQLVRKIIKSIFIRYFFCFFVAILLARKFDLYGKSTSSNDDQILYQSRIDGIVSCAYTDIIANILQCIWANTDFNNENDPQYRFKGKIIND